MKILEINKFYYRRGGADHHFLDLCDILRTKGDSVSVFSMKDKRNEPTPYSKYFVSNIEFGSFNFRSLLQPLRVIYSCEAARKLKRLIKDERPDVAHLHLIYHHLSPSVLSVLKKEKIPVIMTIHDWKPLCPNYLMFTEGAVCERCHGGHYHQCARHLCIHRSPMQSALASMEAYIHHAKKYYEEYVDSYIAPSEFVKQMFIKWGFPAGKIAVIPHFLPSSIKRVEAAVSAPKDPAFAYIGRLNEEKGIVILVEKWVSEKFPYSLHVFGDGPLLARLNNIINSANAKNIFLHGAMKREDISKYLRQMTALIIPSQWHEIFGLVAIEAWSQSVPIITSKFGALPELIKNSGAGLSVDINNGEFTDALKKITDISYRQNAVEYMSGHHLPELYYPDLINVFRKAQASVK
ncbi:MAG: glycosyltransferase [Candidatus Magasanikbacteria bacterium]|nr:glycosyltransferase [Candidatus Magasanikbacteria bacterium]